MSDIPEARQSLTQAEQDLREASDACLHAKEVNNEIPFSEMHRLLSQLTSFTILGSDKTQVTSRDLWHAKEAAEKAAGAFPEDTPRNVWLMSQVEKTKSLAQTRSDASGFAELLGALDGVRTIVGRLHDANIHAEREIEVIRTVYDGAATQIHNEVEQI